MIKGVIGAKSFKIVDNTLCNVNIAPSLSSSEKLIKFEDKLAKKSEKIREKLLERLDKLDSRTQKILDKINKGDYLGKKIGSSVVSETYELVFDSVDATSISDKTKTSSLSGFMSFTTFDKGKSNLKLELQECQITVDDMPYNCGFGKARTTSSGNSGVKDSISIAVPSTLDQFKKDLQSMHNLH